MLKIKDLDDIFPTVKTENNAKWKYTSYEVLKQQKSPRDISKHISTRSLQTNMSTIQTRKYCNIFPTAKRKHNAKRKKILTRSTFPPKLVLCLIPPPPLYWKKQCRKKTLVLKKTDFEKKNHPKGVWYFVSLCAFCGSVMAPAVRFFFFFCSTPSPPSSRTGSRRLGWVPVLLLLSSRDQPPSTSTPTSTQGCSLPPPPHR